MAQNITVAGASYSDVPSVVLPKTGGGTAQFDDTTIASNAAAASDIASGKLAYVNGALVTGTASGGGGSVVEAKLVNGTFTGNGARSIAITCAFEPDLVFWRTDAGSAAFTGTRCGIIVRGLITINKYRNNSTSDTNAIAGPYITDMYTGTANYTMKATYADGKVTIYCNTNAARSYFKNEATYDYQFVKYTA